MASARKATMKAEAVAEVVAALDATMRAAGGNRDSLRASADTVNRLLERFHGYRPRIDAALDDGTFPADSREAVLAVFGDLVRMTDHLHAQLARGASEQAPFLAGLGKAREVAEAMREREARRAVQAERDEAEEDAYRAERAERRAVALQAPHKAPQGAEAPEVGQGKGKGRNGATAPSQAVTAQACAHCSAPMVVASGSEHCVACVSHRNRYGALPSDRVLRKRRGADAAHP